MAQSHPDLNLTETLWEKLKRTIHERMPANLNNWSRRELLKEELAKIPPQWCKRIQKTSTSNYCCKQWIYKLHKALWKPWDCTFHLWIWFCLFSPFLFIWHEMLAWFFQCIMATEAWNSKFSSAFQSKIVKRRLFFLSYQQYKKNNFSTECDAVGWTFKSLVFKLNCLTSLTLAHQTNIYNKLTVVLFSYK